MPRLQHQQQKLAVLFDAENVFYTPTRPILLRAASYGVLAVKRACAHWSRPAMSRFKNVLLHNAMGLVNTGQFDGGCLASSDSVLTPLAFCLRREGLRVYGFGARQTPRAFVAACNGFIYTESIAVAA